MASNAFEVSYEGLAKLLERKGLEWLIYEPIQNAWDTKTETVDVSLTPVPRKPFVTLEVQDDDPDGFRDLSHAWTLFAESFKKNDPKLRGRFNIGEKLLMSFALAYGGKVTISTTKGTVFFTPDKGRTMGRKKTEVGSRVTASLRLTRGQLNEVQDAVGRLIPPIPTVFNGKQLEGRVEVGRIEEIKLPTELADEAGILRRWTRSTTITIHKCNPDEVGWLYEMGIPVVETGDKWHANIHQKIPLNLERDNVTPSYLKSIRVAVLNEMHARIDQDESTDHWVWEATSDKNCSPEAVERILDLRFTRKRVAYDPFDTEANKRAVSKGFVVVHGASMTKGQWSNAKDNGFIKPAGHVTPTPKPFSPDGNPLRHVPVEKWTPELWNIRNYARRMAKLLLDREIKVVFANDPHWMKFDAAYGDSCLYLNYRKLGKRWFSIDTASEKERVQELLLHEFAHEHEKDHLSARFADSIAKLGARLATESRRGNL